METIRIAVLLLFLLSIACSNVQITTVPLPPSVSASEIVSSSTPILRSTKTPFTTLQPIETIPVATLNSVSTLDAIRINLISQFPELEEHNTFCTPSYCYGIEISPNGQWIYLTNSNVIDIFSIDSEMIGKYSFYDIYGYRINYYEGYVEGVHWTKDGRYLYVTAHVGGDGGPEAYLNYKSVLVRISLTWNDVNISGSFKISPNEKFIIYSNSKSEVRIRELSTGQEQVYSAPGNFHYFGKYVWAPNSKKVIFVATTESWETDDRRFALLMVDIESSVIGQILEFPYPFYYPVSWIEADKVTLNKFQDFGEWALDLSANPPTIKP